MDVCRVYLILCSPEDSHSMVQVSDILGQLRASLEDEERGKSSYLAILTRKSSPYKESSVFNKWLRIRHPALTTPLATPSRSTISIQQTCSSVTFKDLINLLALDNETQPKLPNKWQTNNDIHWLLDNTPWNSESYVLMNSIVLIPNSSSLSSFSIESYGELLRLRTWCNSCVYLITSNSSDRESIAFETNHESFTWAELSTSLPAYIGSLTANVIRALSSNIIWKGPMHIPEYKTKGSPAPNAITLPGLTISLNKYPSDVYSAVGVNIDHAHQPSHLELVQVVDINDVPPLWISPVRVELKLDPSFNHTPSFHLFNELFLVPSSTTGVLLRLHMKGPGVFQTQCEYSSDKWHLHILEKEPSNGIIPTYSYLSHLSDLPGSLLLLVHPQPTSSNSCDAQLLWKRQSLLNVGNTVKQLFSTRRNDADVGNECFIHVNKPTNETAHKLPLDGTSGGETSVLSTQLDGDFSLIPEINALRTLETVLKKQMKRKDTAELTLGGVVAPPPSSVSTIVPTSVDLLDCFTDDGRSATMDLSPVAMNSIDQDELHPLHMIVPSEPSVVSYKKVLGSTPRTAKKYHGVSYCFSEEDADRESKLVKIQNCYVTKERSSNCSNNSTPSKGTELKNRKKRISNQEPLKENETSSQVTTNTKEKNKMKTRTHSSTTLPIGNISNIRPRSQTVWSRSRSQTTGFQTTASSHTTTGSHPYSQTSGLRPRSQTSGLRPRSQTTGSRPHSQTTASRKRSLDTMNDSSYSKLKGSKARRSLNIASDEKNNALFPDKTVADNVSSNTVTTTLTDNNTSNSVLTTFSDEEKDVNSPNSIFLCNDDSAKPTNTDRGQRPSTNHHGPSSSLTTTLSAANYKKKKLLEKVTANLLRSRGLSKGEHFTNCYDRLFKICRVYVKDLKAPSNLQNSSTCSLKDQITRIVESNIQQVIDFELQNK